MGDIAGFAFSESGQGRQFKGKRVRVPLPEGGPAMEGLGPGPSRNFLSAAFRISPYPKGKVTRR